MFLSRFRSLATISARRYASLAAAGAAATAACGTALWHQQAACERMAAPASLKGKVALVTGGTGSIGWGEGPKVEPSN